MKKKIVGATGTLLAVLSAVGIYVSTQDNPTPSPHTQQSSEASHSTGDSRRELSNGTAYEWDGDVVDYRGEWEDFLASLDSRRALDVLETLDVQKKASGDNYDREEFGERWVDIDGNGCNTRNDILGRDLDNIVYTSNTYRCVVKSGDFTDPYTGELLHFERAHSTDVQIDHVVALGNAWRTGAQEFSYEDKVAIANDPYNLIAVDGDINYDKGSADASQWLPREEYQCEYVARQIAIKARYNLWVTPQEKQAMRSVLSGDCADTLLPEWE